VAWDTFGNLFFTYIDSAAANVIVALSTNGGASFTAIATIPVTDQPHPAVGAGMMWVVFNNGNLQAAGAPVTGLGAVGAFTVQTVPASAAGNFGGIAISPTGAVVVSFQNSGSGVGPDNIRVSVDPDGLGPAGFSTPTVASATNVGGFRFIPAQPVRSVDAEAKLAFDKSNGPHRGRLYLVYTDAPTTASNDLNIFMRYSDNSGVTWTAPVRVNRDTGANSQFFSFDAVDPTTGNLVVTWYDCRNSPTNTQAETFAAVSLDSGQTFLPNVQVARGLSSANAAGNNGGNDYGDYMGVDFFGGSFYPVWIDNSNTLRGNADRPNFDVAVARVQLVTPVPPPPIVRTYFPFRYIFDPLTNEFRGNLTVQNLSVGPLAGKFVLVFRGLPPGITLLNATGRTAGHPTITFTSSLAPRATVRIALRIANPLRLPLTTFFQGFAVDVILPP
jgi:hypothetical protein